MSEIRKALLIVNKRSGSSDQALDEALDRLRAGGFDVNVFLPDDPAEIGNIIRNESRGASAIILGGGDGTLSASAADLLRAKLTVGILPLGTANDFARGLGIPANLSAAADIIVQGHKRTIDVGVVNERPFLNVASIGMAVDVARFHKGERKRRLRLLSYPLSWIDAYRSHRPFRAELRCEGTARLGRFSQIAVASGRHYGGGMTIEAGAQVDDGWLHVYYVKPRSLWGWLRLLPALRFGTIDREERAETLLAKQVTVATRREKVINVDGELSETAPAKFRILPQSMTVFAPPSA